jgi:hypothetical protein
MAEIWSGVAVNMESARGIAKTITAISKAAPGVILATHDFVNGDYVELKVSGMTQLNGIFRVVSIATTVSFQVEAVSGGLGIDTTLYDSFTSGTAEKITFGTSITTAVDVNGSGGDPNKIDITTIHDVISKMQLGIPSALEYTMNHLWDISSVAQQQMNAASLAGTQKAFKFVFKSGKIMVFAGSISFSGVPTGSAQDKVLVQMTLSAQTFPRFYVS